jgi:hypothetical protein
MNNNNTNTNTKINLDTNIIYNELIFKLNKFENSKILNTELNFNMDWFIGFSEAEGTFSGSKRQAIFQISQHSADHFLIELKKYRID